MKVKRSSLAGLAALVTLLLSSCAGLMGTDASNSDIKASGTISSPAVKIASEIGGEVTEIFIAEGDTVQAGEALFRTDDQTLQAQYEQAEKAVTAAASTVEAAKAQSASAQIQYELALQGARLQDQENRAQALLGESAPEFELPIWYFEKSEKIEALEDEVSAAEAYLATQLSNLEKELADASNDDFVSAEKDLAAAQASFEIARLILQQAQESSDREHLDDLAQDEYDAALDDLEAAQLAYDRKLTTSASDKVLEARAQVTVARLRLDNALDALSYLQSGEESLQVQAAEAGIELAQTAVSQAEANLAQAQAALEVLRIQTGKSEVKAPVSGVITALNLEIGELASPGMVVLTIAQLEEVTLTVYVPENQYGLIQIGQDVRITADSFAGESFTGNVLHIADQAEFTPRNVATTDGRKATVYAIKIRIPNPDLALKPGMPADVEFSHRQ